MPRRLTPPANLFWPTSESRKSFASLRYIKGVTEPLTRVLIPAGWHEEIFMDYSDNFVFNQYKYVTKTQNKLLLLNKYLYLQRNALAPTKPHFGLIYRWEKKARNNKVASFGAPGDQKLFAIYKSHICDLHIAQLRFIYRIFATYITRIYDV